MGPLNVAPEPKQFPATSLMPALLATLSDPPAIGQTDTSVSLQVGGGGGHCSTLVSTLAFQPGIM